jgi:hypothetical protein
MTHSEDRPAAGGGAATAAEQIRLHGHALVDRMADYLAGVHERPVSTPLGPARLATRFAGPVPREGRPAEDVWESVWQDVVGDAIHLAHPMYMGHQVAPPLPQAVLADALASLLNNSIAVWEMSPTGTLVEAQVIRWMAELIGFPEGSDGTIVSGGSAANLTGLLAAREATFPGVWARGVAADNEAARAVVLHLGSCTLLGGASAGCDGVPGDGGHRGGGSGRPSGPDSLSRQIAASRRKATGHSRSWPPRRPRLLDTSTIWMRSPRSRSGSGSGCMWTRHTVAPSWHPPHCVPGSTASSAPIRSPGIRTR